MTFGDFDDLPRRAAFFDKLLRDSAFQRNMMDISADLFHQFINFWIKNLQGVLLKIEIMPNKQRAEELHKPIITEIEK